MTELSFCLLGTKYDLGVEPANLQLVHKWIDKMKAKYQIELPFFQTSALKDTNVKEAA